MLCQSSMFGSGERYLTVFEYTCTSSLASFRPNLTRSHGGCISRYNTRQLVKIDDTSFQDQWVHPVIDLGSCQSRMPLKAVLFPRFAGVRDQKVLLFSRCLCCPSTHFKTGLLIVCSACSSFSHSCIEINSVVCNADPINR